ncbi:MAG TPA: MogA/MoaB family molybdenum cofactor biosynthesis protein [Actinobacteria bacterium]|nr:MogA/MoaB family molybdenum cofactor biosynthesis protein [Actinomycetota bacterium]HDL49172.1 MogA/MoaB family molybdenum cofactor biosynthesis protein [Actinomycetota bacterium]
MRALVLTVSDRVSRGEAEDRSGPAAAERLETLGIATELRVVSDGVSSVRDALEEAVEEGFDLVVTTGGTGFSPRDLTPEATSSVVERSAPGIAEAIRSSTFGINPYGMLSRGVAGITGSTLIVNLPGSVGGVTESLDVIAPALGHAIALLRDETAGH